MNNRPPPSSRYGRRLPDPSRFPTEGEYVEAELEQTRLTIARMHDDERSLNAVSAKDRLQRAEKNARWRHRSFLAGEVNSL